MRKLSAAYLSRRDLNNRLGGVAEGLGGGNLTAAEEETQRHSMALVIASVGEAAIFGLK